MLLPVFISHFLKNLNFYDHKQYVRVLKDQCYKIAKDVIFLITGAVEA